jgi:hypothetical protein
MVHPKYSLSITTPWAIETTSINFIWFLPLILNHTQGYFMILSIPATRDKGVQRITKHNEAICKVNKAINHKSYTFIRAVQCIDFDHDERTLIQWLNFDVWELHFQLKIKSLQHCWCTKHDDAYLEYAVIQRARPLSNAGLLANACKHTFNELGFWSGSEDGGRGEWRHFYPETAVHGKQLVQGARLFTATLGK